MRHPGSDGIPARAAPLAHGAILVAAALVAPAAFATPAVLLEQDRGVFVRTQALYGGQSDEDVGADEASDFTALASSVDVFSGTTNAYANASASVDSDLAGSLIEGAGAVSVEAATNDPDARAEAPGDSFFEVLFEATATEIFFLTGRLDAGASFADAYASVRLVEVATDTEVASTEAGVGDVTYVSETGMLQAGTTYRLTAFAIAYGLADIPGTARGDAEYEVALFLPEPGAHASLAAGLAALAGLHRLRSRRSASGGGA